MGGQIGSTALGDCDERFVDEGIDGVGHGGSSARIARGV